MAVNRMNLGCGTESGGEELTLNECLNRHPKILVEPGINWCHLHQVTEEQLEELRAIFKRERIRYDVYEKSVGLSGPLSQKIKLRKWFTPGGSLPGVKERVALINELEEAKQTKKFTGISPEAYDGLLEKLYAMEGLTDDIEGYYLRFHY